VTITITRVAPHVAPISFAVTGLPAGVAAVFQPDPASGNTSTLTLSATAGATVGAASLLITGTGGGVSSPPLTVPLDVTAAGGGSGNVTFAFCPADGLPVFVAYRDLNGSWTRGTGNASNEYTFALPSGSGGVAVVTNDGVLTSTDIWYGTVAELNLFGNDQCDTPAGGRTVTGSVAGTGLTDFVSIVAGGATATVQPFSSGFTLQNVASGPFDLLATRFTLGAAAAGRFIIRRDLDPANNAVLPVLDFASPEAFDPVARTATITNALGQDVGLFGLFLLKGGASGGSYFNDLNFSPITSRTWYGVPSNRLASTDLHLVSAVTQVGGDAPTSTRSVLRAVRDPVDLTLALPANLGDPVVSVAGSVGGNVAMQTAYAPQPDYLDSWSLSLSQLGPNPVEVSVTMAKGYDDGTNLIVLGVPVFTNGVGGFDPNWGLKPGLEIEWTFIASGYSGLSATTGNFLDGAQFRSASRSGTITP
jgi:hypothetical protein